MHCASLVLSKARTREVPFLESVYKLSLETTCILLYKEKRKNNILLFFLFDMLIKLSRIHSATIV